jgi:hypothetical protein
MAKMWTLAPAQQQLIAAKADVGVGDPEQKHNWTYEQWTPGKRLVGLYLGELHYPGQRALDSRKAGIIAGDGTLLHFFVDHSDHLNLDQALKPVPFGAPVQIDCDITMAEERLVFRVQWKPPKPAR